MFSRLASRGILAGVVCAVFVLAVSFPTAPVPGIDVPDLREELETGLKARRPQEFRFIGRVVALVNADRLPLPLVKGTFQWARQKARVNGHAYQYFERAMRIRAARIGVRL
jgi:hypothetical protein